MATENPISKARLVLGVAGRAIEGLAGLAYFATTGFLAIKFVPQELDFLATHDLVSSFGYPYTLMLPAALMGSAIAVPTVLLISNAFDRGAKLLHRPRR